MSLNNIVFFSTLNRRAPLSSANLPGGYFSSFNQSVSANAGANAFALDNQSSTSNTLAGQMSFQNTFSAVSTGTNQDLGMAQFVSSPLTAQTYSSLWSFHCAAQVSNASATFQWKFRMALYLVNGSGANVGTIKTTIFSLQDVGATGRTLTTELAAATASITGTSMTAALGDYLVWEWGVNVNNTSGGNISPNVTVFSDGTTASITDNTSTSQSGSSIFLNSPGLSVNGIVGRAQLPISPLEQPRGPGWVRKQMPLPPVEQPRGLGWVRNQLPISPLEQPRSGDVDKVLMRGFDSALNRIVYWPAGAVDPLGTQYPGDQSKLSDIVAITITNTTDT